MEKRSQPWRRLFDIDRWPGALVIYTLVAGVICFWRLGATGLVSMEGMVVDGARAMLASGDWVVPRVYGEIYTYKPALAYWLASIPLQVATQPAEWMLRLPFAASGFVMGLSVLALIGRVAGWRIGLFSSIASVGGILFLQKSRMAEFDVALAAGVGVAVAAACYNLVAERPRHGVWLLGYLALAVGFLAKGIPALMVYAPGVVAAGLATARFRRLLRWSHLAAVLVFVALVGGYLGFAFESAGAEAFEQPILESQVRGFGWQWRQGGDVLSKTDGFRFAAQEGELAASPMGALALTLIKPILIWTAFLPWSVLLLFSLRRGGKRSDRVIGRLERAAAAFLVTATLGFMAVPTHEMRYYLPLCVPLGILCGVVAGRRLERRERRDRVLLRACVAVAGILAGAAILAGLVVFSSPPIPEAHRLTLVLAGAAAGVTLFFLARRPTMDRIGLVLVVASMCAMMTEYLGFQPYRASKRNLKPQAQALARYLPAGEPVWVPGPSDLAGKHASLYFYLERPVRSFLPGRPLPLPVSYCILTSEAVDRLTGSSRFVFHEIARTEHAWWSYRVGTCSGSGDVSIRAGG